MNNQIIVPNVYNSSPDDFFETLLSRYFDSDKIEMGKTLFLTHVTKTAITADMYKALSEIDSAEKYHEFKGVYVEKSLVSCQKIIKSHPFVSKKNSKKHNDFLTFEKLFYFFSRL